MSHTESARYLCVSYRHLLNVLSELEEEGLIERKSRGCYAVTDRKGFERESMEC